MRDILSYHSTGETMYRKILTFSNDLGNKQRVYFRDGVCLTPTALETVMNGQYNWDTIKKSGDTTPVERTKQRRRVVYGPVVIDPQYLGLQNPPKVAPKAPRQRGLVISPETMAEIKKLAEEGKTLKQTEAETGIPYAKLNALGKEHGITFVKGKKGKQGSGIVKPLDPELIAKVKACVAEGLTVSQTTKHLGVAWFEIVKIAKAETLTFVKGQRGRQKNKPLAELVNA
jgi:hypothetical protein